MIIKKIKLTEQQIRDYTDYNYIREWLCGYTRFSEFKLFGKPTHTHFLMYWK